MLKKPTLILIVLAVALGIAVYFLDWKRSQKETTPVDTSKPAFSVSNSSISSFTLSRPAVAGDVPIRFEKRNGVWWIAEPINARADQSTADGIIDQLAEDRISQTEPGSEDRRKAYGLDPPEASIKFQLQNGAQHTLLIGSKDFSGDSVYTIVDGASSVALLPAVLSDSTSKTVQQLRDRSVLHLDAADLERVEIKNSNGDIVVSKTKDKIDEWTIDLPVAEKGKTTATWKVIDPFTTLQADEVIDHPAASLVTLLANPAVRADFATANGKIVTLRVSKPSGDFIYAQSSESPEFYKLSKQSLDGLNLKPQNLASSDAGVNP